MHYSLIGTTIDTTIFIGRLYNSKHSRKCTGLNLAQGGQVFFRKENESKPAHPHNSEMVNTTIKSLKERTSYLHLLSHLSRANRSCSFKNDTLGTSYSEEAFPTPHERRTFLVNSINLIISRSFKIYKNYKYMAYSYQERSTKLRQITGRWQYDAPSSILMSIP